ncbi:hypothetical protein UPYG_G00248050 [Umbra pygmaea]|uniref:Ensconsin-like n=1 Tax=Umbra pygmaea TaxID=75934 RepID=A0ABD0WS55_UMBPY
MPVCPRSVSCHPMGGAMSFKSIQSQTLTPCRGHKPRLQLTPCRGHEPRPPKDTTNSRRTTGNLPDKHKDYRSQSPGTNRSRAAAPSPGRMRPPTPRQLRTPDDVGNIRPSRTVPESLSLIGLQTGGGPEGDHGSVTPSPSQPRPQTLGQTKASPNTETKDTLISPNERVGSPPALRPTVGTSDPEEATRILAEKRRQAREQKEREDQERRAQEEQERHSREELAQRKEEEKQRREQESLREEEKRRREEEEREQEEREEAQRQQKQREEEECRQKEELERQRVEREKRFQKEEAERMERKKRLEEIMKRTRRSDQSEKLQKNNPQKTGDQSVSLPVLGSGAEHGDRNGHRTSNPDPPTSLLSPADERENGSFEEVLILPATRPLPPGSEQERSRREPLIAFQENGMVKALPGGGDDSLVHAADVV